MSSRSVSWSIPMMAAIALGAAGVALWRSPLYGAEEPVLLAAPAIDNPKAPGAP